VSDTRSELKSAGYEIFIAALSVISIVNLVLVYAVVDVAALQAVLQVMNGLFSAIFFGDFIYRISTAPQRSAYFFRHFGWADLLASLPFPQFKILRIFRLIRVYRLLGNVGPKAIWRTLVKDRAGSALLVLLLMGILVLQFGSLLILYFEQDAPDANIVTASDAIWYTIVTISTVGYGDQYPVTTAGRIGGTFIIIIGVGIFGTFTGFLANVFLTPRAADSRASEGVRVAGEDLSVPEGVAPNEAEHTRAAPEPRTAGARDELHALLAQSETMLARARQLLDTE
jgi:voltage-gated potassium channel Kch